MKLYFVRHGQTVGNATHKYDTSVHGYLTDLGQQQAEELAGRLSAIHLDAILASPLERTRRTIAPYLREQGRTAELWPELAEGCHQANRNVPVPQEERFGEEVLLFDEDIALFKGGTHCRLAHHEETYGESLRRIAGSHSLLLERYNGGDVSVLVV